MDKEDKFVLKITLLASLLILVGFPIFGKFGVPFFGFLIMIIAHAFASMILSIIIVSKLDERQSIGSVPHG